MRHRRDACLLPRPGFPETITYARDAWYGKEKGLPLAIRVGAFFSAASYLVHHSTTVWLCCCVALHLITFDRALLACTLPLIIQVQSRSSAPSGAHTRAPPLHALAFHAGPQLSRCA